MGFQPTSDQQCLNSCTASRLPNSTALAHDVGLSHHPATAFGRDARRHRRPDDAVSSDQILGAVGRLLATFRAKPSAELVHDLRRDELEMVEVMQVEHLKIDPAGTHL